MSIRVVCISRSAAAGGEIVGRAVSQRLGFRYVDEEIVKKAQQGDKDAKIEASVLGQALELLRESKPARLTRPRDHCWPPWGLGDVMLRPAPLHLTGW